MRDAADWLSPTRRPNSVTLKPASVDNTTSAAAPLELVPAAAIAPTTTTSLRASEAAPRRFAVRNSSCMTHA